LTITWHWSEDPQAHDEPTLIFLLTEDEKPRELARVPARDVGLPLDFDQARESPRGPGEYVLPTDAIAAVRTTIERESRRDELVWLELDPPESVLALAPWESLLGPVGLRRRPVYPFLPVVRRGPLSLALCCHLNGAGGPQAGPLPGPARPLGAW